MKPENEKMGLCPNNLRLKLKAKIVAISDFHKGTSIITWSPNLHAWVKCWRDHILWPEVDLFLPPHFYLKLQKTQTYAARAEHGRQCGYPLDNKSKACSCLLNSDKLSILVQALLTFHAKSCIKSPAGPTDMGPSNAMLIIGGPRNLGPSSFSVRVTFARTI